MQPKRVLLVNPWSSCHGGTSMVLLDMVTHLDRKRFDPLVLCPEPGELPERLADLGVPVALHSITALAKETLLRFAFELVWYRGYLRRQRINLIHFNGAKWRASVAAAARICGIPYVAHVHNRTCSARDNFSWRWAERVIPVSDAAGKSFYADAVFRHKTETVYNGVDLSRFDIAGRNNRHEIDAGDRPVVGFVGHIVPGKGLHTLIEAMRMVVETCPTAILVVVGCAIREGSDYEQQCRQLVNDRNLGSQSVFVGFRQDIPAWMRTFDVFVLPTLSEMCPKVIIEAMAAGRPVVASAVGGVPEIVSRPELGTLVPPDEPKATAQAILRYLTDPELAGKVGQAAAKHVHDHFGVQSMVRRIESIYDEVLASSKRN